MKLCELLYTTQFYSSVRRDQNRVEDAREIRQDFLKEHRDEYQPGYWRDMDASVLEVLMGIAQRLAFKTDESPGVCFWKLIGNLGLDECTDMNWNADTRRKADRIIRRFLERSYLKNGRGGLFPLNDPQEDQRELEIWTQMNAYLWERMPYNAT